MEQYKITIITSAGQVHSETVDYLSQPMNWQYHSIGGFAGLILRIERVLDPVLE